MAAGIPDGMRERSDELSLSHPSGMDWQANRDRWTRCARPPAMISHPFGMNSSYALPVRSPNFTIKNYYTP
jgi:hypothetical protein